MWTLLSDKLTTALQKASDVAIPKYVKEKDSKPWTDERFLELIGGWKKAKNKEARKELNKEVKNIVIKSRMSTMEKSICN